MEFHEFIERVKELLGADRIVSNKIFVEWETGGMDGGNCWGGEAEPYYVNDPEPAFKDLELVLEVFSRKIPTAKYYEVVGSCIKREYRTSESDYYGNETNYESKTVNLNELFVSLNSKGLLI